MMLYTSEYQIAGLFFVLGSHHVIVNDEPVVSLVLHALGNIEGGDYIWPGYKNCFPPLLFHCSIPGHKYFNSLKYYNM